MQGHRHKDDKAYTQGLMRKLATHAGCDFSRNDRTTARSRDHCALNAKPMIEAKNSPETQVVGYPHFALGIALLLDLAAAVPFPMPRPSQ